MTEEPIRVEIPLSYIGLDEVPVYLANHFAIQHHQGQFLLTVGQFAPPLFLGDEQHLRRSARELKSLPVRPIARVACNREAIADLIKALQSNLATFDSLALEGKHDRPSNEE